MRLRRARQETDFGKRGREAQDWGLALLLSVTPTDRALKYWYPAGTGGLMLKALARGEHDTEGTG